MSNQEKYEPAPWILGGCSGRMITTPSGYEGDGFIADVDTKANAQLIACAPEMLELLEEVLVDVEMFDISATIQARIDGLIQKAKGEKCE